MFLPGQLIVCIDNEDAYVINGDDETDWELIDGATYEVLRYDNEDDTVEILNEFGDRGYYNANRFELEANSRKKFVRNLPAWF